MGAAFGAQVSAWPHWITIGFGYGVGLVFVTCGTALIAKWSHYGNLPSLANPYAFW